MRQRDNIFDPFVERRHADAVLVQTMEKIGAKAARRNPLLQILISGGDDPHVHSHLLLTSQPVVRDAIEHPQ